MLIKTLLNKVERFKSFVYDTVQIVTVAGNEALIIDIRSRSNSKPRRPNPCLTPEKINYAISTSSMPKNHRLALHFCLFALNDRFLYSSR